MIKLIELVFSLITFSILIISQFCLLFINIRYINILKKQKPYAWVKEELDEVKIRIKCELFAILFIIIMAVGTLLAKYY